MANNIYAATMSQNLVSGMDLYNPEYLPKIINKYPGQFTYLADFAAVTGASRGVSEQYVKFWQVDRLFKKFGISAVITPAAAPGDPIVLQLPASEHGPGGTTSPLRENLTVILPYSGGNYIYCKITNVNPAVPGAFEYTITPRNTTDPTNLASIAIIPNVTNIMWYSNVWDEGTFQPEGLVEDADSFSYYLSIIKETYEMTGSEAATRIIPIDDSWSKVIGEEATIERMRFQEQMKYLLAPGVGTSLTAGYGNPEAQGLIPWVLAGGVNQPYTAGSWSMTDLDNLTATFDANRAGDNDYTLWAAFDLYRQIENTFQTTFNNGGIRYVSYDGKETATVNTGITAVSKNGYSFQLRRMPIFTDPQTLGDTNLPFSKYGLLIPNGMTNDAWNGGKVKSFELIHRELKGLNRKYEVWKTGGGAPSMGANNTQQDIVQINYRAEVGTYPKNPLAWGIFTA